MRILFYLICNRAEVFIFSRIWLIKWFFNCNIFEHLFFCEHRFNLENTFIESYFLSVNWAIALRFYFFISCAHLSYQEIKHDDQHEKKITYPEKPNDCFSIGLRTLEFFISFFFSPLSILINLHISDWDSKALH